MGILTLDNFDVKGKTVLLRVDMNCPIHPDTGKILGTKRIEEIVETINALKEQRSLLYLIRDGLEEMILLEWKNMQNN